MKSEKILNVIFSFLFIVSCSTTYRMYNAEEQPVHNLSFLKSGYLNGISNGGVMITQIDKNYINEGIYSAVDYFTNGTKIKSKIEMLPGTHTVSARYNNSWTYGNKSLLYLSNSIKTIEFKSECGKEYLLLAYSSEFKYDSPNAYINFDLWIQEESTGKVVAGFPPAKVKPEIEKLRQSKIANSEIALEEIIYPNQLAQIAMQYSDPLLSELAVMKLTDQKLLTTIAINAFYTEARIAAIKKLENQSILKDIMDMTNNKDIQKAAEIRLNSLKEENQ